MRAFSISFIKLIIFIECIVTCGFIGIFNFALTSKSSIVAGKSYMNPIQIFIIFQVVKKKQQKVDPVVGYICMLSAFLSNC